MDPQPGVSAGTPKPEGGLRWSAASLLIWQRLNALHNLQSVTELERDQLNIAINRLAARPEPGPVELVRHLVRHLDPQDALRWHLCIALELTDQMDRTSLRPPDRRRLVDTLQRIASILGRDLPVARISGDTVTDREFRDQTGKMAKAFRDLKIQVLLPRPGSAAYVRGELVKAIYAEACDDWHQMPGADPGDTVSANGRPAGGGADSC